MLEIWHTYGIEGALPSGIDSNWTLFSRLHLRLNKAQIMAIRLTLEATNRNEFDAIRWSSKFTKFYAKRPRKSIVIQYLGKLMNSKWQKKWIFFPFNPFSDF